MTKLIDAAKAAKDDGYKYMTSVVKSVYNTTYHHVVAIDDVLAAGKWLPAQCGSYPTADGQSSWHGRCGTSTVPEKSINKSRAIAKYCK